jgi:hypothetical protein
MVTIECDWVWLLLLKLFLTLQKWGFRPRLASHVGRRGRGRGFSRVSLPTSTSCVEVRVARAGPNRPLLPATKPATTHCFRGGSTSASAVMSTPRFRLRDRETEYGPRERWLRQPHEQLTHERKLKVKKSPCRATDEPLGHSRFRTSNKGSLRRSRSPRRVTRPGSTDSNDSVCHRRRVTRRWPRRSICLHRPLLRVLRLRAYPPGAACGCGTTTFRACGDSVAGESGGSA